MTGPLDGETRYRQMMRARMRSLFVAVEDLIEYTSDVLRPWRKKPETTDYDTVLALLTVRVRGAVAGVVVLAERGFGELGMAAARLAAEGMVAAHWMSLLPEERAERFLAFATFERLELADLLRKRGELRDDEMPPEHRDPEKVEQLRKRFKDKSGWMQVPMKKVIEDVTPLWRTPDGKGEADFAQMVETLHLTGDRHSHVGAGDTLRFLAGDRIALGPTDFAPVWGHQAMIMGGWSLLNTTDLAIKGLKLVSPLARVGGSFSANGGAVRDGDEAPDCWRCGHGPLSVRTRRQVRHVPQELPLVGVGRHHLCR